MIHFLMDPTTRTKLSSESIETELHSQHQLLLPKIKIKLICQDKNTWKSIYIYPDTKGSQTTQVGFTSSIVSNEAGSADCSATLSEPNSESNIPVNTRRLSLILQKLSENEIKIFTNSNGNCFCSEKIPRSSAKLNENTNYYRNTLRSTRNKCKCIGRRVTSDQHRALQSNSLVVNSLSDESNKENRRPCRKSGEQLKAEKLKQEQNKIINHCENGIKLDMIRGKGRGVVTTRAFVRGEFVVEYAGELVKRKESLVREREYQHTPNTGCYMYYFRHNSVQYCVDATTETGRLGRLVNHSRLNANLVTRVVEMLGAPHLVMAAKTDLAPDKELLMDYGDRSKQALLDHPWLRS